MRHAGQILRLVALILLGSAFAPDGFAAGKKPSGSRAPTIAGGYAIPQIARTAKPKAALKGFESSQQLKARRAWRKTAGRRPFALDPDMLTRPATGPDDPILAEFGLPYLPGVPMAALLLPPPVDELTLLFGPIR